MSLPIKYFCNSAEIKIDGAAPWELDWSGNVRTQRVGYKRKVETFVNTNMLNQPQPFEQEKRPKIDDCTIVTPPLPTSYYAPTTNYAAAPLNTTTLQLPTVSAYGQYPQYDHQDHGYSQPTSNLYQPQQQDYATYTQLTTPQFDQTNSSFFVPEPAVSDQQYYTVEEYPYLDHTLASTYYSTTESNNNPHTTAGTGYQEMTSIITQRPAVATSTTNYASSSQSDSYVTSQNWPQSQTETPDVSDANNSLLHQNANTDFLNLPSFQTKTQNSHHE